MKIEYKTIESMSIEEFADKYDLIMEVYERPEPENSSDRYFAHFKSCEIKSHDATLIGCFGNGRTPEEAIDEYATYIMLRRIVLDAMKPTRREIDVPRLIPVVRGKQGVCEES